MHMLSSTKWSTYIFLSIHENKTKKRWSFSNTFWIIIILHHFHNNRWVIFILLFDSPLQKKQYLSKSTKLRKYFNTHSSSIFTPIVLMYFDSSHRLNVLVEFNSNSFSEREHMGISLGIEHFEIYIEFGFLYWKLSIHWTWCTGWILI